MTVHQDYEININLNELIEKRIPCCDLLHPDHCLTEQQVSEIAHDVRMDLNLHDLYKQIDNLVTRILPYLMILNYMYLRYIYLFVHKFYHQSI